MNKKQMIKQINDGNNLDELLPQYANQLATYYFQYSLTRLSMEYYTLYESMAEGKRESYHLVNDTFETVEEAIKQIFFQYANGVQREKLLCEIDGTRNDIIKKMQILTAYADQLEIYEYILNRKEANFYESEEELNETEFVQDVVRFLFASKDNFIVNENIKRVIAQLPVRMAKAKYFELLKDSLTLYKASEQSCLDTYIYMIKTSAMLFSPEGMEEYFLDLKAMVAGLKKTEFKDLDKETYDKSRNELQTACQYVMELSDYYMAFESIINNLYVMLLTEPYALQDDKSTLLYEEIMKGLFQQFEEDNQAPVHKEIFDKMVLTEGSQEDVFTKYSELEMILDKVKKTDMTLVSGLMLGPIFESLFLSEKLLSNSIFIELNKKEKNTIVDENYLEKVEKELLNDMNDLFQNSSQYVKRAIIGNTINKMPVFFHSTEEVVEYIKQSMEGCHDIAEKKACMQLIQDIIND